MTLQFLTYSGELSTYTGREKTRHEVICKVCGKHFFAIRKSRKFCSNYCRHQSLVPNHPRTIETDGKKCIVCGGQFVQRRGCHKPCSALCSTRAYFAIEKNRVRYNQRMREFHIRTRKSSPWKLAVNAARGRASIKHLKCDLSYEWASKRWTGHWLRLGRVLSSAKLDLALTPWKQGVFS